MSMGGLKVESGVHTEFEVRSLRRRVTELESLVQQIFQNNAVVENNPVTAPTTNNGKVVRSERQPSGGSPYLWLKPTSTGDEIYVIGADQNVNWKIKNIGKINTR
jgi:hypothetical protein